MQIARTGGGGWHRQEGLIWIVLLSATLRPSPFLCFLSYWRVTLQFTGGRRDAALQLCKAGGMARLGVGLLRAGGSLSWRQGGAPGFAPGARLLRRGAFQCKQFTGGLGLLG